MSDDALWSAYANTVLRIGAERQLMVDLSRPLAVELRTHLHSLGLSDSFAVVTAFDPGGDRSAAWRNRLRHLRLRVELMHTHRSFQPADGESPDGSHRERGFAVKLARDEAAHLARRFGQLALYWFDGESFWIDGALVARPPQRLP